MAYAFRMKLRGPLLSLFLCACAPAPASDPCNVADFLSTFRAVSGIEMSCRQIYSDTDSLAQSFTIWTDGRATVTYWSNSIAVRITGDAPECLLTKYREDIPRAPMRLSDCIITTLR